MGAAPTRSSAARGFPWHIFPAQRVWHGRESHGEGTVGRGVEKEMNKNIQFGLDVTELRGETEEKKAKVSSKKQEHASIQRRKKHTQP